MKRPGPKPGSPKQPGSGRKKGTPNRISRDVKQLAMELVPDSIKALKTIVNSRTAGRLGAAKEILDRAVGKAPQALVHSGAIANVDLRKATDEDLAELAQLLTRVAERPEPDGGLDGDRPEDEGEDEEGAGGEPGGD